MFLNIIISIIKQCFLIFRFWDPRQGKELQKFANLDSSVDPTAQLFCCAVSSDDKQPVIALASFDGGVFIAFVNNLLRGQEIQEDKP